MSSRDSILEAAKKHRGPETPLPNIEGKWTTYPDRAAQFETVLAAVGGQSVRVADFQACREHLAEWPAWKGANRTLSMVPSVVAGNVDNARTADPHDLKTLCFVLIEGEFGVAENGAVWVDANKLRFRVAPFITQHLGIVLSVHNLVDHMHQAYERLSFSKPGFGVFISGPSKTADIEQSLVIGAHGARTHIVYLIG